MKGSGITLAWKNVVFARYAEPEVLQKSLCSRQPNKISRLSLQWLSVHDTNGSFLPAHTQPYCTKVRYFSTVYLQCLQLAHYQIVVAAAYPALKICVASEKVYFICNISRTIQAENTRALDMFIQTSIDNRVAIFAFLTVE